MIMNHKIIVVTLEGCSKCLKLKKLLQDNSISYKEVSCSNDPELCDELESYTKNALYPILVLKDTISNKSTILHSSLDFKGINNTIAINNNLERIPAINTEDLFKNLLKLIS